MRYDNTKLMNKFIQWFESRFNGSDLLSGIKSFDILNIVTWSWLYLVIQTTNSQNNSFNIIFAFVIEVDILF